MGSIQQHIHGYYQACFLAGETLNLWRWLLTVLSRVGMCENIAFSTVKLILVSAGVGKGEVPVQHTQH
jgi:hypothetical protein